MVRPLVGPLEAQKPTSPPSGLLRNVHCPPLLNEALVAKVSSMN